MALGTLATGQGGGLAELQTIAIAAATAFVVSVVCCRISASITFRIIDRYVKDIVNMAMESIRNANFGKQLSERS